MVINANTIFVSINNTMGRKKLNKTFIYPKIRIEKGKQLAQLTKARGSVPVATFIHNLIKSATAHIEVTEKEIQD